jgi:hypothetical protein
MGRTALSLALATVAVPVWALLAPIDTDVTPYEAETLRHHWRACADVVVVGDSAVGWTVDPEQLESQLPGLRVVNFAFMGVALSGSYIDNIERVLDPSSPTRAILIGFSDGNADPRQVWDDFGDAEKLATEQPLRVERTWRERLDVLLSPRSPCALLFGACPYRRTARLGPAGEIRNLRLPYANLLTTIRSENLRPGRVYDVDLLGPLFEHVRQWRARGIVVAGFVVPLDSELAAIATARGVSPRPMLEAFQAAGGIVLDAAPTAPTFDGLHMTPEFARVLVRELGRQLASKLPATAAPAAPIGPRCPWPEP